MPNTDLLRVQVLDNLYEFQPSDPGIMASVHDVIPTGELNERTETIWRDLMRQLDSDGLIKLAESMGFEGTSLVITHAGRLDVEARRARRNDPAKRSMASRIAVINWLYSVPNHEASGVEPILTDPAFLFEYRPFTKADLEAAVNYLVDAGLVAGTRMMGGYIARPRLTTMGIDCAEQFGGSVSDYLRRSDDRGTQNTTIFNAPVSGNVAWNSQHVQQSATTSSGLAGDELLNMVRAIAEALPALSLDGDQVKRTHDNLQTVEHELSSDNPDAGVVKTFMQRIISTLETSATSSLALFLGASAKELMRHSGIPIE